MYYAIVYFREIILKIGRRVDEITPCTDEARG